MPNKQQQKGSRGRKIGRNKIKCARYTLDGRARKNKARRAKTIAHRLAKAKAHKANIVQRMLEDAING